MEIEKAAGNSKTTKLGKQTTKCVIIKKKIDICKIRTLSLLTMTSLKGTMPFSAFFFVFRSRTVKVKPLPIAEVDLISPMPSPADPTPRSQKRAKVEAPVSSTMNLRRKRIMEVVFTKPITRRKKL